MLYIFQIVLQRYCFSAYYHIDKYRQITLYNKKTAAYPMCNPYVFYTNKFKLQVPCQFRDHHKTSLGHLWAFCVGYSKFCVGYSKFSAGYATTS